MLNVQSMTQDLPSFGDEGNLDYFPSLSDGANVRIKILSAPETYESLYGEKIRFDIEVLGINANCEGVTVGKKYTVSSSAMCYKALMNAWNASHGQEYRDMCLVHPWMITCKQKNDKTFYKLTCLPMDD